MTPTTGKGRDYEHGLARDVTAQTDGQLFPLGGGYNGAPSWDVDMLIDDGEAVHVFELKRTSQDAYTLYWDQDNRDDDDLYGLCKFCYNYPRPTYPYAGVRFNNRELCISKLFIEHWPDRDDILDSAVQTVPGDDTVGVTRADNLRFRRTDDITSQSSGSDVQAVLDAIGYQF